MLSQHQQKNRQNSVQPIKQDNTSDDGLPPKQPLLIGKLGAAHGIKGWVKMLSYCEEPQSILVYPLWCENLSSKALSPLHIEQHRTQGTDFVIKIKHINQREQASLLTHSCIYTDKEQLPPLKEGFYWNDLIHFKVIDEHGTLIGSVDHFKTMPAQDIMVIAQPHGKSLWIPCLIGKHILNIEPSLKTITINREWCLLDE